MARARQWQRLPGRDVPMARASSEAAREGGARATIGGEADCGVWLEDQVIAKPLASGWPSGSTVVGEIVQLLRVRGFQALRSVRLLRARIRAEARAVGARLPDTERAGGCATPDAVTPWWLLGWRCCGRGSRGMFLSAPWCGFGSAGEHYLDLRSSASTRSGRWALDDYSSAAGVRDAPACDPSEAALGGLQAGARRLERLAK